MFLTFALHRANVIVQNCSKEVFDNFFYLRAMKMFVEA